jgi:hypothetical protein
LGCSMLHYTVVYRLVVYCLLFTTVQVVLKAGFGHLCYPYGNLKLAHRRETRLRFRTLSAPRSKTPKQPMLSWSFQRINAMRRCAVVQGRRCQSLFRTRCRGYADVFTDAAAQAARLAADGDIAHGPGTTGPLETASRPKRRPLPISPVMDPAYQAAKQKHEQPKAPRPKDPTAFQRQLARCPYGRPLPASSKPRAPR